MSKPRKYVEGRRLLSHVDLRVRDRDAAEAFYDVVFAPLKIARSNGDGEWVSYDAIPEVDDAYATEWFGFTQDADMSPSGTRIALYAASREEVDRVAEAAAEAGALDIERPGEIYGYYATFFADPDGNKLEVCFLP